MDTAPGGRSITIGKVYRREAKFERIKGLDDEQLKALRYYRATFDQSEASEVKSALDIRPRGGGGSSAQEVWSQKQAGARMRLSSLENGTWRGDRRLAPGSQKVNGRFCIWLRCKKKAQHR